MWLSLLTRASLLATVRRHVVDGKEVEAKPAVPRDSEMLPRPGVAPGPLPSVPGMPPASFAAAAQGGGLGGAPQQMGGNGYPSAHGGGGNVGQNTAESSRKIFVGGLSHETSEADFNAYFGTWPHSPPPPPPPPPSLLLPPAPAPTTL